MTFEHDTCFRYCLWRKFIFVETISVRRRLKYRSKSNQCTCEMSITLTWPFRAFVMFWRGGRFSYTSSTISWMLFVAWVRWRFWWTWNHQNKGKKMRVNTKTTPKSFKFKVLVFFFDTKAPRSISCWYGRIFVRKSAKNEYRASIVTVLCTRFDSA